MGLEVCHLRLGSEQERRKFLTRCWQMSQVGSLVHLFVGSACAWLPRIPPMQWPPRNQHDRTESASILERSKLCTHPETGSG